MKTALFILFFLGVSIGIAETPQEVAKRIIASESPPAYNALNTTADELNRASAINSQLQLRQLMLGDAVSEELRICYPLRVIHERRGFVRVGQPLTATEQKLVADEIVLAAHLRQLNESKK